MGNVEASLGKWSENKDSCNKSTIALHAASELFLHSRGESCKFRQAILPQVAANGGSNLKSVFVLFRIVVLFVVMFMLSSNSSIKILGPSINPVPKRESNRKKRCHHYNHLLLPAILQSTNCQPHPKASKFKYYSVHMIHNKIGYIFLQQCLIS